MNHQQLPTGLKIGDQAFWNDPDMGLCSGVCTVTEIKTPSGRIENEDDVVVLTTPNGGTTEAIPSELKAVSTDRFRLSLDVTITHDGTISDFESQLEHFVRVAMSSPGLHVQGLDSVTSYDLAVARINPEPTNLQPVMERCEAFLVGFEGDPDQAGVAGLLRDIRSLNAEVRQPTPTEEALGFIRQALPFLRCLHASNANDLAAVGTRLLDQATVLEANREVAKVIARGIDLATEMESIEDDDSLFNTSVSVWLESALETTPDDPQLASILDKGIAAAKAAAHDEEHGQEQLMDWASTSYFELCQRKLVDDAPIVVVEISGGICTDVSARGDVAVAVLDYDNGDDDESEQMIPSKGCRASIADYSGTSDPLFCKQVMDLERNTN